MTVVHDNDGVSSKAYDALRDIVYLLESSAGPMHDILDAVNAIDGRFYLPADRRERLRTLRR